MALVWTEDARGYAVKLLAWIAEARGWRVITSSVCGRAAVEIDEHHPYHRRTTGVGRSS